MAKKAPRARAAPASGESVGSHPAHPLSGTSAIANVTDDSVSRHRGKRRPAALGVRHKRAVRAAVGSIGRGNHAVRQGVLHRSRHPVYSNADVGGAASGNVHPCFDGSSGRQSLSCPAGSSSSSCGETRAKAAWPGRLGAIRVPYHQPHFLALTRRRARPSRWHQDDGVVLRHHLLARRIVNSESHQQDADTMSG